MSRWSNILAAGFIAVIACVLSYFTGAASVEPEVKVATAPRVEHDVDGVIELANIRKALQDIQDRIVEKPEIYTVEVPAGHREKLYH